MPNYLRRIELDNGHEYLVGSPLQAKQEAFAKIREDLWAFNASYIVKFAFPDVRRDEPLIRSIALMQRELCEDCNEIIYRLIGGTPKIFRKFAQAAIDADGLGQFLSEYAPKEIASDEVDGLPKGKIAFRVG